LKEIGYKKSGKGMENESRYYNRIEGMVSLFSGKNSNLFIK